MCNRIRQKPVGILASGIAAMTLSCFLILWLLIFLNREIYPCKRLNVYDIKYFNTWCLDETFALATIFILVLSIGSSSMIEEEHYLWHFLTSTFCLVLLWKASKCLTSGTAWKNFIQMLCVILILISGRIMRAWHSGGVNWTHLPDVSKWLEHLRRDYVKPIQLVSWLIIMSLSLYSLALLRPRKYFIMVFAFLFLVLGMLVLQHLLKFQDTALAALGFDVTWMIQNIYFILGLLTFGIVFVLPWVMPILHPELSPDYGTQMPDKLVAKYRRMCLVAGFRDCLYLVFLVYTIFWCLLQQVLQQPMNTMPLSLLLVQILATLCYSSYSNMQSKKWVEVAALYYLGMSGHFSIGNTNTLATIDVAGAFIGISSRSMVLSGMLMSMITYASPMLALLSMVISLWGNDMSGHANLTGADIGQLMKTTISFPCLVPLGSNSVLLISYTILLLLMRNHLFIWSVFSIFQELKV